MALKKLSKGKKRILYCILGFVIVGGMILVFSPNYTVPYSPEMIKKLKYSGESVLVITPRMTETAYGINGFYDYYDGSCGKECLTVPIQNGRPDRWGSYNLHTVQLLSALGYPMMDDLTVHKELAKDSVFLEKYHSIILLHSEYVTPELYQGIATHPHVIYLAPNALYAMVLIQHTKVNDVTGIDYIHLVKGHNYPDHSITNGFGWKYDNSNEEYDLDCTLWNFRKIDNGYQLNCVQEIYSQKFPNIIQKMKELINE